MNDIRQINDVADRRSQGLKKMLNGRHDTGSADNLKQTSF